MIDKSFMFVIFDEILQEVTKLEENLIVMNKFN